MINGNFPDDLKALFTEKGAGLFPAMAKIHFGCSCPDYADMCKHVAAVLYGIGNRFDKDPLLFFTLRGKFMNDILEADHAYEDTCEMVAALSCSESREIMDNLIDSLPSEAKAAGLTLALCFCAVDETISREEVAYFKKLMDG